MIHIEQLGGRVTYILNGLLLLIPISFRMEPHCIYVQPTFLLCGSCCVQTRYQKYQLVHSCWQFELKQCRKFDY